VEAHVETQALLKGEGLGTLRAGELLPVLVGGGDVVLEVDRLAVTLSTILALVRPFVRVNEHVSLQVGLAAELFGAVTADMVLPFHWLRLPCRLFRQGLHVIGILRVLLAAVFIFLLRTGISQTSQAALSPLYRMRGAWRRFPRRRRRGQRDSAVRKEGDGILLGHAASAAYHWFFLLFTCNYTFGDLFIGDTGTSCALLYF